MPRRNNTNIKTRTMEEKNIFFNAEGAFKAIGDAVEYLGGNGYVEGLMVLCPTEKSDVDGMMQLFAGTELDVASCLMVAARESKNIKDVIMKVGRVIAEKWDEYEAEMAKVCEMQEEDADE